MKKLVTLLWTAALLGCLTVVAYADAIGEPLDSLLVAAIYAYRFWPWILVAVVVIITLVMLKKYRRK